jgi:hypothetical protein
MPIPGDVDVRSGFGTASADSDEKAAQTLRTVMPNQRNMLSQSANEVQVGLVARMRNQSSRKSSLTFNIGLRERVAAQRHC